MVANHSAMLTKTLYQETVVRPPRVDDLEFSWERTLGVRSPSSIPTSDWSGLLMSGRHPSKARASFPSGTLPRSQLVRMRWRALARTEQGAVEESYTGRPASPMQRMNFAKIQVATETVWFLLQS
jgi:hypothetical protein